MVLYNPIASARAWCIEPKLHDFSYILSQSFSLPLHLLPPPLAVTPSLSALHMYHPLPSYTNILAWKEAIIAEGIPSSIPDQDYSRHNQQRDS